MLRKLKESGKIQPEQVVALRASRVFQNDLWINSFGDLEAINESSVQRAQQKYEETLIAEEEKHNKELQAIEQQHTLEIESIQNEMRIKEKTYIKKIEDNSKKHCEYIRNRDEADRQKERNQNEEIRRRADEFARNARDKWLERRIKIVNILLEVLCGFGLVGLGLSVSFEAPLWISILIGVFLIISAVSVYDTVYSKKAFIFNYLAKMSYDYETRVREEKIAEYRNLIQSQDSTSEDNDVQTAGV